MKSFLESSNLRFPLKVLPPYIFLNQGCLQQTWCRTCDFSGLQFKSSASVQPLLTTTMLAPYRTSYSPFQMKLFEYLETATTSFGNCPANRHLQLYSGRHSFQMHHSNCESEFSALSRCPRVYNSYVRNHSSYTGFSGGQLVCQETWLGKLVITH